jgi:hypothetical protein
MRYIYFYMSHFKKQVSGLKILLLAKVCFLNLGPKTGIKKFPHIGSLDLF